MAKIEASAPPAYSEQSYGQQQSYGQPPPPGFSQPVYTIDQSPYQVQSGNQIYVQGADVNVVVSDTCDGASSLPAGVKHAETYMAFTEKSIRFAFIRKVYTILTLQLLLTFGIVSLFIFVIPIKEFCLSNPWMIAVAFGVMIFSMILLCYLVNVRRKYPLNIILLLVFTLSESFAIATLCSYYTVNEVLIAFGITMVITISITIFTFQNKWDFTFGAVALFVFVMFLLSFGAICGFYYGFGWYYHCYPVNWYNGYYHDVVCYRASFYYPFLSGLLALIFALYLIIDTQMMLGGKHKYGLSPEEYIFASLNLYLDVILIFLYLLMFLGGRR